MSTTSVLRTTLVLAPLLGACSAGTDLAGPTAMTIRDGAPPLAESIAPGAALAALPPEAGAVVSVVQTRRSDGFDQKITLVGDAGARGDNEIAVAARKRARGRVAPQIDEATIQAEMAERLPGVAMTITPRVVVAPAGPVGIATGRTAAGSTCLYAWSSGTPDRPRAATAARLLGLDGAEPDDVQVRVRLCRHGASEEALVTLVEGLRIRSAAPGTTARAETARPVTGTDALASAGYDDIVRPATAVEAPARPTVATSNVAAPVAAKSTRPTAVSPAPTSKKSADTVAADTPPPPAAPAIVAGPIPLPSGG